MQKYETYCLLSLLSFNVISFQIKFHSTIQSNGISVSHLKRTYMNKINPMNAGTRTVAEIRVYYLNQIKVTVNRRNTSGGIKMAKAISLIKITRNNGGRHQRVPFELGYLEKLNAPTDLIRFRKQCHCRVFFFSYAGNWSKLHQRKAEYFNLPDGDAILCGREQIFLYGMSETINEYECFFIYLLMQVYNLMVPFLKWDEFHVFLVLLICGVGIYLIFAYEIQLYYKGYKKKSRANSACKVGIVTTHSFFFLKR